MNPTRHPENQTDVQTKAAPAYCLIGWDCNGITTVQWCRAIMSVLGWNVVRTEDTMVEMMRNGVVFLLTGPLELLDAYAEALNSRGVLSTVERSL